ncbi:MAG: sigma-70 family RNA polymerase sigma factor [Phycisphaeraceae bacterium]|nr:sigma-70 family RNA polymerase sigma factor [Phycisphaeraceae bacterium]MBX3405167.1 sigma-70 family RNA polymerase sigma factor [Phycisphaeraceae bacterium]
MTGPTHANPEPSDAVLVARARRGDHQAFETLYRRYRDWCVRIAFRFCRDESAAWDATHDAFAWLIGRLPTLTLDGRLGSLLYPVIKNAATTAARKESTRTRHESAAAARPADQRPAHDPDLATIFDAALRTLPEPQRETLLMRTSDGLSMEEIARALGVPVGTVKSRLHHALAALRENNRLRALYDDHS